MVLDLIFEFTNCRTDGRRPTIDCLNVTYFALMGEAAQHVQNEGMSLEKIFTDRSKWTHYWKESIVCSEGIGSRGQKRGAADDVGLDVPSDLARM